MFNDVQLYNAHKLYRCLASVYNLHTHDEYLFVLTNHSSLDSGLYVLLIQ